MDNSVLDFLKQHNNKRDVGSWTLKFGRCKDRTFQDVYDNEKTYVAWCLQNLSEEKNSAMLDYFKSRIQEEHTLTEEQPKKKAKKAKKKVVVKEEEVV